MLVANTHLGMPCFLLFRGYSKAYISHDHGSGATPLGIVDPMFIHRGVALGSVGNHQGDAELRYGEVLCHCKRC